MIAWKRRTTSLSDLYRILSLAGPTSGAVSWNSCMIHSLARLPKINRTNWTKTASSVATSTLRLRHGASVRSSTSSLVKEVRRLSSCTQLVVIVANTMGKPNLERRALLGLMTLHSVMNDPRAREKLRMTAFDLPAHGRSFPVSQPCSLRLCYKHQLTPTSVRGPQPWHAHQQ